MKFYFIFSWDKKIQKEESGKYLIEYGRPSGGVLSWVCAVSVWLNIEGIPRRFLQLFCSRLQPGYRLPSLLLASSAHWQPVSCLGSVVLHCSLESVSRKKASVIVRFITVFPHLMFYSLRVAAYILWSFTVHFDQRTGLAPRYTFMVGVCYFQNFVVKKLQMYRNIYNSNTEEKCFFKWNDKVRFNLLKIN